MLRIIRGSRPRLTEKILLKRSSVSIRLGTGRKLYEENKGRKSVLKIKER